MDSVSEQALNVVYAWLTNAKSLSSANDLSVSESKYAPKTKGQFEKLYAMLN